MTERVLDLRRDTGVGIDEFFIDRCVPGHGHGLHGLGDRCQLGGTGHCFLEHTMVIDIDGPSGADGPGVAHGVGIEPVERFTGHPVRKRQYFRG